MLSSILKRVSGSKAKKRIEEMKPQRAAVPFTSLLVFLVFSLALIPSIVWSGLLRISMSDGSVIEVPYFWEENGEVKFEFAGGVAGIPRAQVTSIQEILTAKEFDPEVLLETPKEATEVVHTKKLQEFIANQLPSPPSHEKLNPEQSLAILQSENFTKKKAGSPNEVLFGPLFNLEASTAELVRIHGGGVLLVMQNILSSRKDLRNHAFTLVAYDAEGNALQRKPCEVNELAVDRKTQKNLEIPGHIFSVTATVRPDPKIKRFEIVSARR
jgi:hypothetical protein